MFILHYIVICVVSKALCAQAEGAPTDVLDFNNLNNGDQTDSSHDRTTSIDLTRKGRKRNHHPLRTWDIFEPKIRSNKNRILTKRIVPHKIKSRLDGPVFYRPLLTIHNVKSRNNILDREANKKSEINIFGSKNKKHKSNKKSEDKFRIFKIMKQVKESKIHNKKDRIKLFKIMKKVKEDKHYNKKGRKKEQTNKKVKHGDSITSKFNSRSKLLTDLLRENAAREGTNTYVFVSEGKFGNWQLNWLPWNYFTYWKSIHQDSCPGDQVRVGDMCIMTPPH